MLHGIHADPVQCHGMGKKTLQKLVNQWLRGNANTVRAGDDIFNVFPGNLFQRFFTCLSEIRQQIMEERIGHQDRISIC